MKIARNQLRNIISEVLNEAAVGEEEVSNVVDWWVNTPPGSKNYLMKRLNIKNIDHRRWNATDWKRAINYYRVEYGGDPRGYKPSRSF